MNAAAFEGILEKYGETVEVCYDGGAAGVACRAFVQPLLDRRAEGWQEEPTPLGIVRRDHWLYLGAPGVPLEGAQALRWRGKPLEIMRAQPVGAGGVTSHWWAVLRPGDGEDGA